MGLDQYAYRAARAGQWQEFYDGARYDPDTDTWVHPAGVTQPHEFAAWRKHPNLQGWMKRLYESRGGTEDFNGVELELTWEDLDQLERDITSGAMAQLDTRGFFFGHPSDEVHRDRDLEFIRQAKTDVFMGLRVFYNSSW